MTALHTTPIDDIRLLLRDWGLHLRAKGCLASTISSYTAVAAAFGAYLSANGMPTSSATVSREYVEHYLADLRDRVSPATTAKTTARCSSCFGGSSRRARSPAPRWSA